MHYQLGDGLSWIEGLDGAEVLVCLRTGRIVATLEPCADGVWLGRAFISPLCALAMWWFDLLRFYSLEIGRRGFTAVSTGTDWERVQEDTEMLIGEDAARI